MLIVSGLEKRDENNRETGDNTQVAPGEPFVGGMNNAWYLLGSVDYVAGTTYSVTMEAGTNSFVSQRVHGIFWEYAPVATERGDFNNDEVLDAVDIDLLSTAIREELTDPMFDLNSDGDVDNADRQVWVNELRKTWFGDANMDSEFNSSDFVAVFVPGQYEDGVPKNSGWATGDWNGDADFDSGDFVTAFVAGGYELGPREEGLAQAVPEPSTWLLLGVCAAPLVRLRRRTKAARSVCTRYS